MIILHTRYSLKYINKIKIRHDYQKYFVSISSIEDSTASNWPTLMVQVWAIAVQCVDALHGLFIW